MTYAVVPWIQPVGDAGLEGCEDRLCVFDTRDAVIDFRAREALYEIAVMAVLAQMEIERFLPRSRWPNFAVIK